MILNKEIPVICHFECLLSKNVWNLIAKGFWKHPYSKVDILICSQYSGPWFNIKKSSYQYRKSHCGDKTILRPSYLHNGISYTGKMTSLYWISPLLANCLVRCQDIYKCKFITWTSVYFSLLRLCGIHLRAVLQQVTKLLFCLMSLKIMPLKLLTYRPGNNELKIKNIYNSSSDGCQGDTTYCQIT